jgi:hypothetical protein
MSAYCTCIWDVQQVSSAIVWAYSIKKTNSIYPVIIMVAEDLPVNIDQTLLKAFDHVYRVAIINSKIKTKLKTDTRAFTRWQVFQLKEWTDIVLMDCNMIVVRNLDMLFNYDTPACICSLYNNITDPVMDGQKIPASDIRISVEKNGIRTYAMKLKPEQQWLDMIVSNNKSVKINKFITADEYIATKIRTTWTHISMAYFRPVWQAGESNALLYIKSGKNQPTEQDNKMWFDYLDRAKAELQI